KRLQAGSVRRLSAAANNTANAFTPPLRQFLITNKFSGVDNPQVFGVTYNLTNNPGAGNISGSTAVKGEVFVISPTTFDIRIAGGTRNGPGGLHGYQQSYLRQGANFLVPNPNASVRFASPTETVPLPPNPATGFPGQIGVI